MKKTKTSREQGQAIVEMCICLIPIMVVVLGMIFIATLGVANIRTFINAKENAEIESRYSNAVGGSGNNIHSWDYGDPSNGGDGYPFTDDDQIIDFYQANSETNTISLINSQLNDIVNSESQNPQPGEEYIYVPTAYLNRGSDYNFALTPPSTMLDAADLVEGQADSDFINFNDYGVISFNLLGIDFESIDLQDMRANKVYYPAMPAQTGQP